MNRHVLLLRGINVGGRHRVPMAQLRTVLQESGFTDVATHMQSGNVVLSSRKGPATLEREVPELLARQWGFAIPVTVRSATELAAIVAHDPIADAAAEPKLYQVTFLAAPPPPAGIQRLRALAAGDEQLAVHGRELYTWHPDGIARSKLAAGLTVQGLGLATARNWRTVTTLLEMTAAD